MLADRHPRGSLQALGLVPGTAWHARDGRVDGEGRSLPIESRRSPSSALPMPYRPLYGAGRLFLGNLQKILGHIAGQIGVVLALHRVPDEVIARLCRPGDAQQRPFVQVGDDLGVGGWLRA